MKHMVMECHPGYAVVLDENGRFLKTANLQYEVGQIVTEVVELQLPEQTPRKKQGSRILVTFAAMAACMALAVTGFFHTRPYASVYMKINPEVRIDVNRRDRVVDVEGMNPDGTRLLEGYEHAKKDLDTVMDELVDRAIDLDYLHEGGTVSLSLDAEEDWVTSHSDHLDTHLQEYLTDRITVTIDVERKTASQPAETVPAATVVIPVTPQQYGESDYGQPEAEQEDGDSGYEDRDDGQDDDDDRDAEDREEAESPYREEKDGASDYEAPEKASPYEDQEEKQSPYDRDDGQTDYGDSGDEGESDYEAPKQSGKKQTTTEKTKATDTGKKSVKKNTASKDSDYDDRDEDD